MLNKTLSTFVPLFILNGNKFFHALVLTFHELIILLSEPPLQRKGKIIGRVMLKRIKISRLNVFGCFIIQIISGTKHSRYQTQILLKNSYGLVNYWLDNTYAELNVLLLHKHLVIFHPPGYRGCGYTIYANRRVAQVDAW